MGCHRDHVFFQCITSEKAVPMVGSQFCSVPAMGLAPYDPVKGFAPISLTFRLPTLLVVPMDSPAKTVAELLAWGKTKPGGLLLGSPGAGTPGHLLAAKIALATNTPIQYIHYRGGAPVMADLVTGRVDFSLASFNSARSNMDAKKLRALAVDAEAAWATYSAAMLDPAPGLFSTRICWPRMGLILSPRMRAVTSDAAPAVNPTMMWIGRDG